MTVVFQCAISGTKQVSVSRAADMFVVHACCGDVRVQRTFNVEDCSFVRLNSTIGAIDSIESFCLEPVPDGYLVISELSDYVIGAVKLRADNSAYGFVYIGC